MESSDETDVRAFWNHVRHTTGGRFASWDTFSAGFETYMRRRFPGEMSRVRAFPPVEMVLRYAFGRGSKARASASARVTPNDLNLFLKRFGPMRSCLLKTSRSLFDDSGCLAPWFHGMMSRDEAARAIDDWEASHGSGKQIGVFLFRYSNRPEQPEISFSYRSTDRRMLSCLVLNNGAGGYVLPTAGQRRAWQDLREFVSDRRQYFVHPVPSALHLECKQELEVREKEWMRTPEVKIADARHLFGDAKALVYTDIEDGREPVQVMEEALGIIDEVVSLVRDSELDEPQLEAKALRLAGDIQWKLRRYDEGMVSYQRCLHVVSEAQDSQAAESPVVTVSVLSHVHRLLAGYFLREGLTSKALYHFGELVACTTDEDARQQLVEEFRRNEEFRVATESISHESVQAVLDEGITYFRRKDYEPAGVKFEKALCDARCIGEGKEEARALGNLATVEYKTCRIPAAIRKYRTCVQLLRQQGDQVTERKILNYLVMCCIEDQRWEPAKLFHKQLSKLAESDDNISHLRRLEVRIQEGMDAQAKEQGASLSRGNANGVPTRTGYDRPPESFPKDSYGR